MPMIHDVIGEQRNKWLQCLRLIDAIRFRLYLLEQRLSKLEDTASALQPEEFSREALVLAMEDSLGTSSLFAPSDEDSASAQTPDDLGESVKRGSGDQRGRRGRKPVDRVPPQ